MSREGNVPPKKQAWGYDEESTKPKMTDEECLNILQRDYKLAVEKFITHPVDGSEGMRVLKVWDLDLIEGVHLIDMQTGEKIHFSLKEMLGLLKGELWKVS